MQLLLDSISNWPSVIMTMNFVNSKQTGLFSYEESAENYDQAV